MVNPHTGIAIAPDVKSRIYGKQHQLRLTLERLFE